MTQSSANSIPKNILIENVKRFLKSGTKEISKWHPFQLVNTIQTLQEIRTIFLEEEIDIQDMINQALEICYLETEKFGVSIEYNTNHRIIDTKDTVLSSWLDWWKEYTSTLTEIDWRYFIQCQREQKIPINLYPPTTFEEFMIEKKKKEVNYQKKKK